MAIRFSNVNATPPGGCYEYSLDGKTIVTGRSRFDITAKARKLRAEAKVETIGDPFRYVMEYMCPRLPSGFCNTPSHVKSLRVNEVKEATAKLFALRCATSDVIESRMIVCVACPCHTRQGFCVDCSGLLDWMYRGYTGRRSPLPEDRILGVCTCDAVLAAAGATAATRPLTVEAVYPETCWRLQAAKEACDGNPS